jgi:predicted nucleic acid-binding protein
LKPIHLCLTLRRKRSARKLKNNAALGNIEMTHLDTNFLIHLLEKAPSNILKSKQWAQDGESIGLSAISWAEFMTGPVTPDIMAAAITVIGTRIIPFRKEDAELAADLYNKVGRQRFRRVDSMIAAVAILSGAPLATDDPSDFSVYIPFGLRLA